MNLNYRTKFKQISRIEVLGNTLKGKEICIFTSDQKIKTFGDVDCLVIDRFGQEHELKVKDLTTAYSIKVEQFSDQLF